MAAAIRMVRLCSGCLLPFLCCLTSVGSQGFHECHDDPNYHPEEGPVNRVQFTWLGALQYIHVKNASPHYFRVPRVILISRQFVVSTAMDAARVPDDYALGNVVFGDYERDERECKLSVEQLALGAVCEPAVLMMPIADVLLHPEYVHFKVKNSIALLKLLRPIQSSYVIPVCLPLKNYLDKNEKRKRENKYYYVDFMADVPRDFIHETKEVRHLKLIPREICYHNTDLANVSAAVRDRVICTTGCGFHSGGATLIHEHTGHWTLFAISEGGSVCPDPLVARRPAPPPRHVVIYSYVSWITAAISGRPMAAFTKSDPFGYVIPRADVYQSFHDLIGHDWNGHWWMGGMRCWDRGDQAIDLYRFYHEIFQIKPVAHTNIMYYLEIDAAHGTTIICVKVGMPYRLGKPKVSELDSPMVKVLIPLIKCENKYTIQVEAFGYNSTETSESTSESDF